MRLKLNHILAVLFLAILTPAGLYCVQAQDASLPLPDASFEITESDKETEKIIYSAGESETLLNSKVHVVASRDTAATKPTRVIRTQAETPKNSAKPSSQEDDSILSFNFLYYLFEKYKMQDIVD